MKKFIYILLFALIGLYSCSNNSDEPGVTPPLPPSPSPELTLDKVIGKWETYYATKLVIERPETAYQKVFSAFRAIDLDGFTFELFKENSEYRVNGYNAKGVQTSQGWYEVKTESDSIIFHLDSISPDKEIFPNWKREGRHVRELDVDGGIIKWDLTYYQRTKDGVRYKVTDVYASRNVDIAPEATNGVNPAKAKIDYDDLCRGIWVVKNVDIYYDGTRQPLASIEAQKIIYGTIYDFSINEKGEKTIRITYPDNPDNPESLEVNIIDDVMFYPYIEAETGEEKALSTWIEKFANGNNSFYDIKASRYEGDLSVVIRTVWRFDREM